ncbi:hypothetical protein CDD82_5909 [Ophiocordyceps australis]|uniref:Pumilio homology domain family member 3 n=1 Tax=Ophiocordyceps australis TaxID=1399860 RepID=A0A2C5YYY6_9HYPO|nr:hypothetical protein CDD82_5909 [Ophiocordyceps australis]
MPPESTPQEKPLNSGSAFPGGHFYPSNSIWGTSTATYGRDRSIPAPSTSQQSASRRASDDALVPRQPGLSLSDTDDSHVLSSEPSTAWPASASAWPFSNSSRSISTSPSRAREDANSSGSAALYDHQSHHQSTAAVRNGSFGAGQSMHCDDVRNSNGFAAALASSHRRPTQEVYADSTADFSQHQRQRTMPPSRHSYDDVYRGRHTPNSSVQSQRQLSSHSSALSSHAANQRAYNHNLQIDEDLPQQFSRHLTLDSAPMSQPFQLNPGSQSWAGDALNPSNYHGGLELSDSMNNGYYLHTRQSPRERPYLGGSSINGSGSARLYSSRPSEQWQQSRPSSRSSRTAETERRVLPQQYATPNYMAPYIPGQYIMTAGIPAHYPSHVFDQFVQGFRQPQSMMTGYNLSTMPTGYALAGQGPHTRQSRDQDCNRNLRSALLEEFRTGSKASKRMELKDIYGHVVEFSGDQHGSRFIQHKLETANSDEKDHTFREIEPNAVQLMKDVFGNYVIQKFFEHGNQVQKKILADKMKGKVVDLSTQIYACRVVQKALEHVLVEQQAELAKELEPEILRVIRDQNGNHVVQKVVELVPLHHVGFIMEAMRGQVTGLASHLYACRVVQRMLEHAGDDDRNDLMRELHLSAPILITDQFGNYVAQHVIEHGKPEDRQRMIGLVMTQLLTLSKHKFASNVVEKCIAHGTAEQRTAARELLMSVGSDGSCPLPHMMRDQYGNYVVQKLVSHLEGSEREAMVEQIKPQYYALRKNGSSKQLQALEKLLGLAKCESVTTTPLLTNETNSPTSSSPPSVHASTVGDVPCPDGGAKVGGTSGDRSTPTVRQDEL